MHHKSSTYLGPMVQAREGEWVDMCLSKENDYNNYTVRFDYTKGCVICLQFEETLLEAKKEG